jgi:hypothetical protein
MRQMLSSISNSESAIAQPRLATKTIAVLLSTILLTLLGFEIVTRVGIERKSKVQRMVNEEYAEALRIRPASGDAPRQLLVIGNSLVGHGIDFEELRKGLEPQWQVHCFWIYNTSYTDWYFGLKRLLEEGSRPDVIAVVFAAMHWDATGTRGDYASQYLFETRDIPEVTAQLRLDKTATTSLLLARFSKFYALRSEIRKVLLNTIMPDLPQMYKLFKPGPSRQISDYELIPLATRRMQAYKDLLQRYGVDLVLIVPPVPPPLDEHHRALHIAAARAGVDLFTPMTSEDLRSGDFADDVHLTPDGAKLFTARLIEQLKRQLPILNERPAAR